MPERGNWHSSMKLFLWISRMNTRKIDKNAARCTPMGLCIPTQGHHISCGSTSPVNKSTGVIVSMGTAAEVGMGGMGHWDPASMGFVIYSMAGVSWFCWMGGLPSCSSHMMPKCSKLSPDWVVVLCCWNMEKLGHENVETPHNLNYEAWNKQRSNSVSDVLFLIDIVSQVHKSGFQWHDVLMPIP